jgi:RNase P subunit RPR2
LTKTTAKATRKRGSSKRNAKPRSVADPARVQKSESIQPEPESIPATPESNQPQSESIGAPTEAVTEPLAAEPLASTSEPAATKPSEESKPGRRPGSKNVQRDEVDVVVSRCKACQSTRRTPYGHAIVQECAGTDGGGKPFTHVIARPTTCKDCGQARRDISYENHPNKTAGQVEAKLLKKKRR